MPSTNPVLCGSIAGRTGSFGVAMHNAAYRALGLNYTYVAFGTEDTAGAIAAMRSLGIRGLGVTMPHKIRIMTLLDVIDDTAGNIGSVNTVVNDAGVLTGHNVDWIGAVMALREKTTLVGKRAAVIGAGGGARAVVYGLVREGCQVTVFNRTESHGRDLAESFGMRFGGPPEALARDGAFDLLAHVTPIGFHAPADCLVPPEALRKGMVVFDAVPVPLQTRLLQQAEARGCVIVAGVRMQIHQAAAQFALYTGQEPELATMEAALLSTLER